MEEKQSYWIIPVTIATGVGILGAGFGYDCIPNPTVVNYAQSLGIAKEYAMATAGGVGGGLAGLVVGIAAARYDKKQHQ